MKEDNKILIAKRRLEKSLGGYWEFPGGKIEANESPEECLVRELQEEFSVQIEVICHIKSVDYDYGNFKIYLMGYLGRIKSGNFNLTDHDEISWVSSEELLNYKLAPADIPIAKEVIERHGGRIWAENRAGGGSIFSFTLSKTPRK